MGSAAEQSKADGNAAFKLQDYPLALSHYSTAIQLDPSVSTYPLNRSLVHLKLSNWKDAEKDAKRALELDGGVNVKALFRRGLARKGMGKLQDAKKDFEEAIGQGAGQDVQAELAKVKLELALDAKGKSTERSKLPSPASTPSPASSTQPTQPSTTTQSKSDRLRAAIASPSSPTSSPLSPTPTPNSQIPPSSSSVASKPSSTAAFQSEDSGFMKAVSTRKLKPTPESSSPVPPPKTSPEPVTPEETIDSKVPEIVKTGKTPESTSSSSLPPSIPSTSSAPPSSTSFASKKATRSSRQSYLSPLSTPSSSSLPLRSPRPTHPSSSTLTSLESSLLSLTPSSPARKDLLRSLDPKKLVGFMGDSLTPDLLSLILAELDTQEDGEAREDEGWKFELLEALGMCRRFGTAKMMLGEEEVGVVKRVLDGVERRLEGARGR